MLFYDIESNQIITQEQLHSEYMENRKNFPEEFDYSFSDYIHNCLTDSNGTLEPIDRKIRKLEKELNELEKSAYIYGEEYFSDDMEEVKEQIEYFKKIMEG